MFRKIECVSRNLTYEVLHTWIERPVMNILKNSSMTGLSVVRCLGHAHTVTGLLSTFHCWWLHVTSHNLVCSKEHPFPAPHCTIYISQQLHPDPNSFHPLSPILYHKDSGSLCLYGGVTSMSWQGSVCLLAQIYFFGNIYYMSGFLCLQIQ